MPEATPPAEPEKPARAKVVAISDQLHTQLKARAALLQKPLNALVEEKLWELVIAPQAMEAAK